MGIHLRIRIQLSFWAPSTSEYPVKSCENAMSSLEVGEDLDLDLTATHSSYLSLLDYKWEFQLPQIVLRRIFCLKTLSNMLAPCTISTSSIFP